jgi:hypothetical protein
MRTDVMISVLLLLSFPLGVRSQEQPATATPMASSASVNEQPGAGKEGDSVITFFRESHIAGSALKPSVYVDGKETERLANGCWFSVHADPGKHEIQSSAKNEPATVIDTKAGETTYVQMVVVMGTWRGAGRLLQVAPEDAHKVIAKLKPLRE